MKALRRSPQGSMVELRWSQEAAGWGGGSVATGKAASAWLQMQK